jgi:hypothetical protein
VLLILRTNKQPSEPKLTYTHNRNMHGLLPVLHRSNRWPAPIRPVTPVRPVDRAGQVGGYNNHTTNVPESLSDFSWPWNKNTLKTQPARKRNPTQTQPKHLRNCQDTRIQQLTRGKSHKGLTPGRQVKSTGQTGVTWTARDELNLWVNSSESNSRSPDSLHGSEQNFRIVGTPHGHSIEKLWSTKTR